MPYLLADFEAFFVGKGMTIPIFTDNMPDDPDSATAIYEYGGEVPLPQIASVNRSIQIVTRDRSPAIARTAINAYFNALMVENGIVQLTTDRWGTVTLRNTPMKLKAEKGRTYYCFNLGINTYND